MTEVTTMTVMRSAARAGAYGVVIDGVRSHLCTSTPGGPSEPWERWTGMTNEHISHQMEDR